MPEPAREIERKKGKKKKKTQKREREIAKSVTFGEIFKAEMGWSLSEEPSFPHLTFYGG